MPELTLTHANALLRQQNFREALVEYRRMVAESHPLARLAQANIDICLRREAKGCVAQPAAQDSDGPAEGSDIVICLTTIDSRLHHLRQVIESLHDQKLPPVAIRLYVSREAYLLDAGISEKDPLLQAMADLPLLQVHWVPNIGPYRKIMSFLKEHFSHDLTRDKLFVTVDDDTIYPPDFLQTLYENFKLHDCVVAFRGREMVLHDGQIGSYADWGLGLPQVSLANLPTGKDGVLYSTRFFTREFLRLDDALSLAPTADDLWIKWHCAGNGVPSLILNPEACTSDYKSFPTVNYSNEYRCKSLYSSYNSSDTRGKNDDSVRKLEVFYTDVYGLSLGELMGQAISV